MSTASALITGAGGFIGSHLTERLSALGWKLYTVERGAQKLVPDGLSVDYIFHLAGSANVPESIEKPLEDFDLNARLTLALLEQVRALPKFPKVVYVSSAAVYGNPVSMPITEETPFNPMSPYAVSKLAAEQYMRVYSQLHNVPTLILRPFSVYGPRQEKLVVWELLQQLKNDDDALRLHGDGTQSRDFIHVDDMIQALLQAAHNGAFQGEAYNVASGHSITIKELAQMLIAASGQKRRIEFSGQARLGEPSNWEVNINKLRTLGFIPEVNLQDGLNKLVQNYCLTATKL